MKPAISVLGVAVLAASSAVSGAVSEAEFAQMRADFAALAQRLNVLEAENERLRYATEQTLRDVQVNREQVAMVRGKKPAASWTDRIRIRGDFRYRYESIEVEDDPTRDRNRIRARAAIIAKLEDNVEVGLGFSSPVSIMPGMDTRAPDRTETRRGAFRSPKISPMAFSSFPRFFSTCFHMPGGNFPCRFVDSTQASVVMVKPGGTRIFRLVISARFDPFPPKRSFILADPSARPLPKKYTYFFVAILPPPRRLTLEISWGEWGQALIS